MLITTTYDIQKSIEHNYSRKNIRNKVLNDINKDHSVLKNMYIAVNNYRTNVSGYYDSKIDRVKNLALSTNDIVLEIMIAVLPIKEISPIQSITTLIGNRLGYTNLLDGIKTASELLAVCESSGAYVIYHSSDHANGTGTLAIKPNFSLEAPTANYINQTKYLPPMVCKPDEWVDNTSGGYIQGSGSVILGSINHHDKYQALDVINILQNIAWSLNEDTVIYEEISNKDLDTADKQAQFNTMCNESNVVYQELLDTDNKFYFTWKYDKRGRSYSQGYHCNLQSTEYKKSILNFANKELIT